MKISTEQRTLFPESFGRTPKDQWVDSPFRYPGGKYYGLKFILPFLRQIEHDEYREPFLGGGCVFFAKEKVRYNWLNDLDEELIETYRVMADPKLREELCELLGIETASKTRHAEVKNMKPVTPLEVAFQTYYLNRTSFSGIIHKPAWGYAIGQSVEPPGWPQKVRVAGKKLEGVTLTAIDFEKVVAAPPEGKRVLMYLDPPYFASDQKRAYEKSFTIEDHKRLEHLLRRTEHPFVLSYDDSPKVREMYSWARIHSRKWWYNTANVRNGSRKMGSEIVIVNFDAKDVDVEPQPHTKSRENLPLSSYT